MAGPLGLKADDRELSALELMMEHADSLSADVIGAPRSRRRRARSNEATISARDFMRGMAEEDNYQDYEYYVGPGSRALNRELRERRAQQRAQGAVPTRVSQAQTQALARPVPRPNDEQLEHALESIFTANAEQGTDIVDALHDNTKISAQTAQTLKDWMEWEKAESFKDANRARTEDAAPVPTSNLPAVQQDRPSTDLTLPDADFPEEEGRGRRTRRVPRRRRTRGRGKWGALAGLAAVGGAFWWANHEKSEQDGTVGTDRDDVDVQAPAAAETPRQEKPLLTQEQKDMAFDATSLGALALGGAKRIPFVGPAVALAGAGYNAEQIANDNTLSESEKTREQTKNVTSSVGGGLGATAGAWIGGTLGSVVPGAGTLAGAALGSVIGGLIGDALGDKVGDAVADSMDKSNEKAAEEEKQRQDQQDAKDLSAAPATGFMSMMPNWFSGLFGSGGNSSGGGGRNVARPAQFDSKQINDFADKASRGGLGSVSAQFESGGRGVGTVSTGAGDYGGVSYGTHQLATTNGSMMNFLNSKEGQPFAAQFGGQAPGTAGFNAAYKNLASTQGDAFEKAQNDYIARTHYAPQAAKLKNDLGFDVSKRGKAVQEMVYSTAVQYGGNTSAIKRALQGLDLDTLTDDQIINTVQQSKAQNVGTDFKSSSADVQASVAARAENERKVLTQLNQDEQARKSRDAALSKALSPDDAEMDRKIADKFPGLGRGDGSVDQTNTKVDANLQNMPDMKQKGSTVQAASTPEEKERRLNDIVNSARGQQDAIAPRQVAEQERKITPVEREQPAIERQPLVTADDIPQPPEPPVSTAASETKQPTPAAVRTGNSGSRINPGGGGAKTATLDDIPVFLDDPTLQMINVGYM